MNITCREDILETMPKNAVVAELGVFKGVFARKIYDICTPSELHLIDCWQTQEELGRIEAVVGLPQEKHDANLEETKERFNGCGNIFFHVGFTSSVVFDFQDDFFDWIYVDANHTYEGAFSDLTLYFPKVKTGGYIVCDDYCDDDENYYGVKKAISQFCAQHQLKFNVYPKHRDRLMFLQEAVIRVER
jgi:hypothetical protein